MVREKYQTVYRRQAEVLSPSSASAWELAIQQYVARIPELQRPAFTAPADAESCLNLIVKAQGRKRGSLDSRSLSGLSSIL